MGKRLDKIRKAMAEKLYTPPPPPPVVPEKKPVPKPVIRMRPSDCKECKCKEMTGQPCHRLKPLRTRYIPNKYGLDQVIKYYKVDDPRTHTTRMAQKFIGVMSVSVEMSAADDELRHHPAATMRAVEEWIRGHMYEEVYRDILDDLRDIADTAREIGPMASGPEIGELLRQVTQLIHKCLGE